MNKPVAESSWLFGLNQRFLARLKYDLSTLLSDVPDVCCSENICDTQLNVAADLA